MVSKTQHNHYVSDSVLNNRMGVVDICAQGGSGGLSQNPKFVAKQHSEAGNNNDTHFTDTLKCPSSEKGWNSTASIVSGRLVIGL